jgi:hypothetical protein
MFQHMVSVIKRAQVHCVGLLLAASVAQLLAQQPASTRRSPQDIQAGLDIAGTWTAITHEDGLESVQGPYAVDYTGLPLNDDGRAKALSWTSSAQSMLERQCTFWPPHYLVMGPWPMRIWPETDFVTGRTVGWTIGAWEDKAFTTFWLDGRSEPSPNERHTQGGFSSGVWDANQLITTTTHLKAGVIRRNGAPSSDEETLSMRFIRHGDLLTVLVKIDDPVYLSEPLYRTKTFRLNVDGNPFNAVGPPCLPADEGSAQDGTVRHFLPGQNPSIDELTRLYGIPREATLGGAETMYPEYRRKLKDQFVRPDKCTMNCGGPATPAGRRGQPPSAR